jgi:alginate O-acetyltransferase complex protein AlgJ
MAYLQQYARVMLSRRLLLGLTSLTLAGTMCCASIEQARAQASIIKGQDGWLFPGWESLEKVDSAGLAATIGLIQSIRGELAASKIGLVVVIAPMKAPFHQDKLLPEQKLSPEVLARYGMLLERLKKSDIPTVDAVAVMTQLSRDKRAPFFRADYHWTGWAAEAVATAVAKVISDKWRLAGNSGTGAILGEWVNERRFGDLAANFMSAEERKVIGREVFTVRKAPEQPSKELLDEVPAPVHVVGNSFVQPYLGFPQKLSNALDRQVSLTWNPGDVGPWSTFLQYLESPSFKAKHPQVIVWQFNEGQMHQSPDAKGQWEPKSVLPTAEWLERVRAALQTSSEQ